MTESLAIGTVSWEAPDADHLARRAAQRSMAAVAAGHKDNWLGLFTAEDIATFRWQIELDEQQIRRLFGTFSEWSADEVEQAADAVIALGGRVVEHPGSVSEQATSASTVAP